jgi:hypothetical protein
MFAYVGSIQNLKDLKDSLTEAGQDRERRPEASAGAIEK